MTQITSVRLRAEPKIRKDRKCVIVECRKPLPIVAVEHEDPFCSNKCCKAFYGISDEGLNQPQPHHLVPHNQ